MSFSSNPSWRERFPMVAAAAGRWVRRSRCPCPRGRV
uniref:Uncharacterized protein n=1 Tax=Arundo donax TaxID=35708 RepID=A0A0A9SAX9_ARUDO